MNMHCDLELHHTGLFQSKAGGHNPENMLSLKCKVNSSVVELKLRMKMISTESQPAEKQGSIHAVCSGYCRRLGEEGLVIILCMFVFYNSILNLDTKNTMGSWDLDI